MKKKVLLILLFTLFIPNIVFATSNEVCKRTKDNNWGVNKRDVNTEGFDSYYNDYINKIPCVDPSEYVYDFGNVLSDSEEKEIKDILSEFENKYHIAAIYYTYDYPYYWGQESKLDDFAHDFYDLNDFGLDYEYYDGVYLFENAYQLGYDSDSDGVDDGFYMNVGSKGGAQLYYYDDRLDEMIYNDDFYNELKYGDKVEAVKKWVDLLEDYYNKGKLEDYTLDEDGNLLELRVFHPAIVTYFLIGGIISAITTSILVHRNKMVKTATRAREYLNKDSLNITNRKDVFLRSHTTSYVISSSSGSGGGGGHHSSGGSFSGGHSSGGGRH